jgi:glycosyltransferase involved in cell wall biosynthesis
MRIVLVDQFGEMGGGQRCLLEAAAGFHARGWATWAAAPPHGPFGAALAPYCAGVASIPCGPFRSTRKGLSDALRFAGQLPPQAATIARLVQKHRADVVYVNGPRVLAAAALGRLGRPLIYHAHWMPPQRAASSFAHSLLRWSRASVIAPSRLAAEWLQTSVASDRVFTIYNGVAGPFSGPVPRDRIASVAVLGRISPEKGQLEFVRAARIVSERIRGLRFIVCGAPLFSERRYFDEVRAEANGSVQFESWTEEVPGFLAGIDLLVVPSLNDNLPRVILEAFAAGVAVLAFDAGAIPELVEHGQTGLLVRERTAEALAQAILVAIAKPDTLNDLAARAHRRLQERYTLARFQSEICAAVEFTLRRHHERSPVKSAGASAAA